MRLGILALVLVGCGASEKNGGDSAETSTATPTGAATATGSTTGSATGTATGTATGSGTATGTSTGTGSATGTGTGTGSGTGTGTAACTATIVDPNLVNCAAEWWSSLNGGAAIRSHDTTYDACGRLERMDTYFGATATPGTATTWEYDATGALIRVWMDGDYSTPPDGVPDVDRLYSYDTSDRLDLIEQYTTQPTPDCSVDYVHTDADDYYDTVDDLCAAPATRTTHTWQTDGDPITQDWDQGIDGTIESSYLWTYDAYDEWDNLLTVDAIGLPTRTWYTWSGGQIAQQDIDLGDDGIIETIVTWTYDSYGRITVIDTNSPVFGFTTQATATWTCVP